MKRRIEIGLFIAVVVLGVAVFFLTWEKGNQWEKSTSPKGKEITVRNVTKEVVYYQIKPSNSFQETKREVLEVGSLHRYKSKITMDIMFERAGRMVTHHLTPGKPYSFRYDANNLIKVYEGSHGKEDAVDLAPFVPTPMEVVEKMLELAEVDSNDVLYDIGCGDGRIVITAALDYGTRGVGIDIVPQRIKESRQGARDAGVEKLVRFYLGDATKMDISQATVVTLYLLPESNELLRPQLEMQLKSGACVVSHNFQIAGWEEKEIDSVSLKDSTGKDHTIFLYRR